MLIYNDALADEICALNSIYGNGTITVTFSSLDHTTISLRIYDLPYAFLFHVFSNYPEASVPKVLGVDNLVQSGDLEVQQNAAYFQACIHSVYRAGEVCFFDAVEEFEPILRMQMRHRDIKITQESQRAKYAERSLVLGDLVIRSVQVISDRPNDRPDGLLGLVECVACMEYFFKVDTARLQCRHCFCRECLHDGLLSLFRVRDELKCCGKSIPLQIVRNYGDLDEEFLDLYVTWLRERHSAKPLYCPYKDCRAFIHQVCVQGNYAKCPFCKKQICASCKEKQHSGICKGDQKLAAMIKQQHWKFCPQCGHLVERTHGCNHMSCVCGTNFCYRCGQKPGCSCGIYEDPL